MKSPNTKKQKRERIVWGDVFPKTKLYLIDNGAVKKIRIEGAKKLILCIEKEVKILLSDEVLGFVGKELSCISYTSGALEVTGEIDEIRFEKRIKNGEARR